MSGIIRRSSTGRVNNRLSSEELHDADLAQQVEQLTCNHQVTSSTPVVGTICGHRIMAITSAFQADDAGSIPAARSSFLPKTQDSRKKAEGRFLL